jgi:DNA polymerase-3 subunit alpha
VDPIRFKLLFERFINPERLDLPDADLDFQSSRRHEVVAYLSAKYGADKVAGISNYSSLASSSALRDAGRVHELPPIELTCTKLVPKPHGIPITLTEAADQVSDIEKFKSAYPAIWGHALKLEGAMRSFAQHAAGVVVAGEPLVNRAVVETRNESPVVNWDKRAVEDFGLVKMDILGLSTLDVIQIAKEKAEDLMGGAKIDLMSLPLDDEKVLEAFGKGDTIGVFQFEGGGMRKLLKDLALGGPLTFNDLAATTALFRPGPIDAGLMDDYVSIRQGYKTIFYEHPAMESALKDTFGVIIFQEQVMQLARDVAGFSMAGADHLRKAMGKKDAAKMAEQREAWIDGCLAHVGMPTHTAAELFDKIEKFAGYGFNLSHAVEYTVISWWCMWLKIYHPGAFYAASLTVNDDEGKLGGLVNDAKARGFAVYPPDINLSGLRYHASADRLLAPFHAVKGISDTVATHILAARDKAPGGKFTSREHFESLVNKSKVNQRHRDALDKVGAFADVEAGQPAARDPARLRNQMELLPGIIQDVLKADRLTNTSDKLLRTKVIHIMNEYRSCKACPKQDEPHPAIRMGNSTARYMVVFDGPSYYDGKKNKLLEGDNGLTLRNALKEAGVDPNEGYFTALVKAPKDKGEKFYSNEVLNACTGFLKKELELIKPAVIVTMGGAATRFFLPDVKAQESMGKHVFRADLDATIVVGLNVAQIAFDGTKAANLTEVCEKLAAVLG